MSNPQGLSVFIAPGQTQGWTLTYFFLGWPGNLIIEPQALNPGGSLTLSMGAVTMNTNSTYTYAFSVTNVGPFPTLYDFELTDGL